MANRAKVKVSLFNSISYLLAKMGVIVAFIFGILLGTVQVAFEFQRQEEKVALAVEEILAVAKSSAIQAVYEYDEVLANEVVKGVFIYPAISQAIIYEDFGEVLAKSERLIEVKRPSWLPENIFAGEKHFQISLISQNHLPESQAKMLVLVNNYAASKEFFFRALLTFSLYIILSILLSLTLLFIFYFLLSKPLRTLSLELLAIAPDNPQASLAMHERHQHNEIGILIHCINRLLESINDHIFEVKELNEHLEQRVESRTHELTVKSQEALDSLAQLKDAQEQLIEAEKNAALSGLVAGVAHEINTPLGITVTAASSLQERLAALNKDFINSKISKSSLAHAIEHINECTEIILSNSERAAALICNFKQVAVDQTSYEKRCFDFKAYLESVVFTLQPKLKKTNITTKIDCEQEFSINSYPGAFAQIISNLILNAILHGFNESQVGEIEISIKKYDDSVDVNVCDNGKGISTDEIDKIFDPFYTTKRGQGGSGLGLHIVSNIVTNTLDGKISCESSPGKGCCFYISFPLAEQ